MGHLIPGYWTSVLVSVVLHEAAHLATALSLHVKVKRIGLNWRGPYILRESGTPVENTVVSLAGPAINLALCILSFHVALTFALVNGFLSVFNLLPFIPSSDGQRIYRLWRNKSIRFPEHGVTSLPRPPNPDAIAAQPNRH